MRPKMGMRRIRAGLGCVLCAGVLSASAATEAQATSLIRSDLEFVLEQIEVAEAHAAGGALSGTGPDQISNPLFPYGLRTVTGEENNLIAGQEHYGAADNVFTRLLPPVFAPAEPLSFDPDGPGPAAIGDPTSYEQTRGIVQDSEPRAISNLIVDQTANNPAAAAAAEGNDGATRSDDDGNPDTPDMFFIPNRAPDEGLSAPYNSWFTLFGQFFDHGLDLTTKGSSGTVMVPLRADDPLIVGPDGEAGTADDPSNPPPADQRFMVLTRATNEPGPDGVIGDNPRTPRDESADDRHEHTNTTTSFVDQNQTYTSHPSHQVFLREYARDGDGRTVATGRMLDLDPAEGGLADWTRVKAQARELLGIQLSDSDVLNVPLLATDQYGRFLPGPNGYAQIVTAGNRLVEGDPQAEDGRGVATSSALRTNHAFLDDIAHHAVPFGDHDGNPMTPRQALRPDDLAGTADDDDPGTYDDELLGAHFVTGDGRGNENIGLTAVHYVFHAEHNRLVGHIQDVVIGTGDVGFLNQWLKAPVASIPADRSELAWDGERLFQAARFATEMQYQHLVFEEFARKVQPQVNVFATYETDIDASIVAEFAHTVYRFGHSMLTDTLARTDADGSRRDLGLIEAFLNPLAFSDGGLTPAQSAGAIVRGMTRQRGNEIDEFVTESLRNNLLGLPLDLATINLARGREAGVPSLNAARRTFNDATSHSALAPYESWTDFKASLRHPESLINFIAGYGTHDSVVTAESLKAKRKAAALLVLGGPDAPADRLDFLDGTGAWASGQDGLATTGLEDVDFWIGGLAERQMPFGGLLGSTFNFVFETQMEKLQDGDRLYYLGRTAGLNFLTQLEESSFAELVMRNTDAKHLPFDVFSTPDYTFELSELGASGAIADDPATFYDESQLLTRMPNGTVRFGGGEHIVMGGTNDADRIRAHDGDDTLWGDGGRDRLEGGAGNDALNGNAGDDVITDEFGDDNIKGGDGDDAVDAGSGIDLILSGFGDDFVVAGADPKETFAGGGDDMVVAGDSSDTVFGNEGDDWIEGGAQADLLQGGNGDPFQDDTQTGHDVIIGGGGNDDYDAEGGDDVMVAGPGIERNEGMLGFDWVTHKGDPQAAHADMAFTGLLPPDEDNVRDRFDLVEGLSGWKHGDVLRGDSVPAAEQSGNELATSEQIDRIGGLRELLGPDATGFTGGNIILGGAGSDLIEGRGGNDLLDGDAWLDVQLETRDRTGRIRYADGMAELQADVFAGRLDPGDVYITRHIRNAEEPGVDTAEFSGPRSDYVIEPATAETKTLTVTHTGGSQIDGTDVLRNVERLKFADQTVEVTDIPTNTPATGTVRISDVSPTEGQPLTATPVIADLDAVDERTIVLTWQAETKADEWTPVGVGAAFTPGDAEVGSRLRVVATFRDFDGVLETVTSAATAAVGNLNDRPTGLPLIDDRTPTEGGTLTVATGSIADADGLEGVALARQWQRAEGATWEDIAAATGATFTPGAADVGKRLRVAVTFTDNGGTAERVLSAETEAVAAAPSAPAAPLVVAAPPAIPSPAPPAVAEPARPVNAAALALARTVVPRALEGPALPATGVRVSLTAPAGTRVLRVDVVRAGTDRRLARVFVRARPGRTSIVLRRRALTQALRRGGRFRIELTPGASRRKLGVTTVKKLTVRR